MSLKDKIFEEIKFLKQLNILESEDSINSINESFYLSSLWPEVFWRRKTRHQSRPDPEIPFVIGLQPKNILEIGSAYGRVTRKLIDIAEESVTGLELNPNFQNYIEKNTECYPELNRANFIYGSIFEAKKVFPKSNFDVILIPMNTVPNFPFDSLDLLFKNLNEILAKEGYCVFSVHNRKINSDDLEQNKDSFDGELLVEKRKPSIAQIAYSFPLKQTEYGYSQISYLIHHILNEKMCSEEKIISRSMIEFVETNILERIIVNNGFSIESIDKSSFSKIFIIRKL